MRRRRVVLVALIVVLAAGWFLAVAPVDEGRLRAGIGCGDVPSGSAYGPYGDVTSCREIRRVSHWFGSVDGDIYVLIDTSAGLVALRIEYRNLDLERQYVAAAVEVSPDDAGLGPKTSAKLQAAIDRRGGLRPGVWTVHYGDG